ncbi:CfaE/CblD family pilus tip adhesin [Yersinia thracica]|uniref:CfaE/CblD family pilus tip adhesin n=1 Tax=Yersinia thracica TaxID=2890319 RepID=UPI0011A1D208|nr:CfaE/CblD family pilus tip adhesin [Yersinia thracica]
MLNIILLLLVTLAGSMSAAYADRQNPSGRTTVINIGFDKMSVPSRVPIWTNESGGYDTEDGPKWARNTLVCLSNANAQYGQCQAEPVWHDENVEVVPYLIPLIFTETTTNKQISLNIYTLKTHSPTTVALERRPYIAQLIRDANETSFTAYIPASEMAKLPTAGVWKAELRMALMQWVNTKLFDWRATITLRVTDYGNQQIYLPQFGNSAPQVDLGLQLTTPGSVARPSTMKGSKALDMCLYDGNDGASNRISLLLQDEGGPASGRGRGMFSVYRTGADKTNQRNRLDYSVSIINPTTNRPQPVTNGSELIWTGTNRGPLRRVVLPGQLNSVLCVPAPIELVTPEFNLASKASGRYSGRLRIIYTPTTQ